MEQIKTAPLQEHQRALYSILEEFDRICKKLNIRYFLFSGTMLGADRHQGFIPWDDDVDVAMLRQDYQRFLEEARPLLDQRRFFLQKEFSEHWPMFFSKLRLNGTTCLEKYHPRDPKIHQGVYIDIFPCDNAWDNPFLRKMQFYASKVVVAKSVYARGYETDSAAKKVFMQLCRPLPRKLFWRLCTAPKAGNSGYVHVFLGGGSRYSKSVFERRWFDKTVDMPFEQGQFQVSEQYDALLSQMYGDYMTIPPEADRVCKVHAILVDLERSYEEYEHYRDDMEFTEFSRSIR
jgi:lipopolysaccharide cholinephosphotransferase